MARIYITKQGDMIDAIAFAQYGHHEGTAEAIFEANRELAEQPLKLPAGLEIVLPDLPTDRISQPIRLWN